MLLTACNYRKRNTISRTLGEIREYVAFVYPLPPAKESGVVPTPFFAQSNFTIH
nr:MAG TPA: hypothetical protein [Caudoviricetes sp.]